MLGGSAYAATQIEKNAIKSKHIGAGQIKSTDLADGAVSSQKVEDGSLLGEDFDPGQLPQGAQGPKGGPSGPRREGDQGIPGPAPGPAIGVLSGNYPGPGFASGVNQMLPIAAVQTMDPRRPYGTLSKPPSARDRQRNRKPGRGGHLLLRFARRGQERHRPSPGLYRLWYQPCGHGI